MSHTKDKVGRPSSGRRTRWGEEGICGNIETNETGNQVWKKRQMMMKTNIALQNNNTPLQSRTSSIKCFCNNSYSMTNCKDVTHNSNICIKDTLSEQLELQHGQVKVKVSL
jgi:hypothetical protein